MYTAHPTKLGQIKLFRSSFSILEKQSRKVN